MEFKQIDSLVGSLIGDVKIEVVGVAGDFKPNKDFNPTKEEMDLLKKLQVTDIKMGFENKTPDGGTMNSPFTIKYSVPEGTSLTDEESNECNKLLIGFAQGMGLIQVVRR